MNKWNHIFILLIQLSKNKKKMMEFSVLINMIKADFSDMENIY